VFSVAADLGVNLSPLSPIGRDQTFGTAWVFLYLMKVSFVTDTYA
jgi:hypothetical protein